METTRSAAPQHGARIVKSRAEHAAHVRAWVSNATLDELAAQRLDKNTPAPDDHTPATVRVRVEAEQKPQEFRIAVPLAPIETKAPTAEALDEPTVEAEPHDAPVDPTLGELFGISMMLHMSERFRGVLPHAFVQFFSEPLSADLAVAVRHRFLRITAKGFELTARGSGATANIRDVFMRFSSNTDALFALFESIEAPAVEAPAASELPVHLRDLAELAMTHRWTVVADLGREPFEISIHHGEEMARISYGAMKHDPKSRRIAIFDPLCIPVTWFKFNSDGSSEEFPEPSMQPEAEPFADVEAPAVEAPAVEAPAASELPLHLRDLAELAAPDRWTVVVDLGREPFEVRKYKREDDARTRYRRTFVDQPHRRIALFDPKLACVQWFKMNADNTSEMWPEPAMQPAQEPFADAAPVD